VLPASAPLSDSPCRGAAACFPVPSVTPSRSAVLQPYKPAAATHSSKNFIANPAFFVISLHPPETAEHRQLLFLPFKKDKTIISLKKQTAKAKKSKKKNYFIAFLSCLFAFAVKISLLLPALWNNPEPQTACLAAFYLNLVT
jgi:hypothetical protein